MLSCFAKMARSPAAWLSMMMKSLFSKMFSTSRLESRSFTFWVMPVGMPPHLRNRIYLENGNLNVELLGQGFTWLDTGTHESLVDATNFIKTVETHQHRKIACLEEIAYLNGWITKEDVLKVYEILKKNQYGQYLKDVLDGKYVDILR